MAKKKIERPTEGFNEILLYTTSNGAVKVEIYLQNETVWLTQQKIADLFGVERSVVTKHIKNIFATQELDPNSVCAKIAHTASDGDCTLRNTLFKVKVFFNHGRDRGQKRFIFTEKVSL
jgi:hypothetical protein